MFWKCRGGIVCHGGGGGGGERRGTVLEKEQHWSLALEIQEGFQVAFVRKGLLGRENQYFQDPSLFTGEGTEVMRTWDGGWQEVMVGREPQCQA